MTALKREGHASIRGIIIANSFQDRVKLAAEAIDNLELVEYAFQFSFKTIK
jgi:RecB family endonuclease NucS